MKGNYHIKTEKGYYKLTYSGDLEAALEKAKTDLQKERENTELLRWEWIKKKAETAIKAHKTKIEKLETFIRAAEREINSQKEENKE